MDVTDDIIFTINTTSLGREFYIWNALRALNKSFFGIHLS